MKPGHFSGNAPYRLSYSCMSLFNSSVSRFAANGLSTMRVIELDPEAFLRAAFPSLVDAEIENHFLARAVRIAEVRVGAAKARRVPLDESASLLHFRLGRRFLFSRFGHRASLLGYSTTLSPVRWARSLYSTDCLVPRKSASQLLLVGRNFFLASVSACSKAFCAEPVQSITGGAWSMRSIGRLTVPAPSRIGEGPSGSSGFRSSEWTVIAAPRSISSSRRTSRAAGLICASFFPISK